jgi:GT2 family glycosyltransferase
MADTCVLILNWNNQNFLEKFLPDLISHTPSELADIVIADNASTDNSVAWLEKTYPDIKVISLDKNYGFAGGYNRAIEAVDNRNIVLMNSDIQVTENWLPPLLVRLSEENTAAVMPKIRSWHQKDSFEYAGAAGGYIDKLGYPFCRGRIFDTLEKDDGQYDTPVQVHWTTGGFMIVKRDLFLQAGGFDDDFFAHMEEIDLCWRIRRMGYALWYEPTSMVYHVGGGSLPNESPRKLYLNFRNNLALLYKNLPGKAAFGTIFLRMVLDGVAGVQYLMKGKLASIGSILKAHLHFYSWRAKLRREKKASTIPLKSICNYPKSIVFQYFARGKKKFSDLNYK